MQNKVRIATAAAAAAAAAAVSCLLRLGLPVQYRLPGLVSGSAWSPILAPISGLDKGLHAHTHAIRTCVTAGKTSTVSL
jgi:hypothetical protein